MSQSDYLKHKRSATLLASQSDLEPILTGTQYSNYTRYQLANTITNTKNTYSMLLPTGKQKVFSMEKKVSGCTEFTLCMNTQSRPNRRPIVCNRDCRPVKPYVKQPSTAKKACDCALNRSSSNVCKCATSH